VSNAPKLLFLLLALFFFLSITPSHAQTILEIPAEYGEIIYRFNERSPNQIFIIGISHRDALTCLNGDNTSKVQAQIYQIGDWLIHNQGLELLLPEGFFKSLSTQMERKNTNGTDKGANCSSSDLETLERRLSDNRIYVNAEMLLKENHPLRLRQIEDKNLYEAVRNHLFKLASDRYDSRERSVLESELEYLQKKRTAAMLQKIPLIVNEEFRLGNIKKKEAIFTIGMFHLHDIITFLDEKAIRIYPPLSASSRDEITPAELNLQKENFGVSVILPRVLMNDQRILEMNELYKVVRKPQQNPFPQNR
jgi:hypothetical protein